MTALLVSVLRDSSDDCTARGITSKENLVWLFSADSTREEIKEFYRKREDSFSTALRVVVRENPIYGNYAEVVFKNPPSAGTYMAGGNYVVSSDSRYKVTAGINYPISVHDRFESWEENEALSI